MTSYAFHPEARLELRDAARYYEDRRAGLGYAFLAEVRRTVSLILRTPHIETMLDQETRRRALNRFPYDLIYSCEGERILILALMHQKRRPGYWKDRR
jgi:plasmid stabilization system protein ParE